MIEWFKQRIKKFNKIKVLKERLKNANEQIELYKERFNFLNNSETMAKIGSWYWNVSNNELYWTDGLKNIYEIDDVTFEKYMASNHPDDISYIKQTIQKCIQDGKPYEIKHRLMVNNNIKYLHARGEIILINNEKHLIGYAQDITMQKIIETKLIESKKIAEKNSEMKSAFVANISHEIRTPINAIIGMTTLLQSSELNQEQRDDLNIIVQSSGLLLSIINNVLDFSKIESGKVELDIVEINIRELLNNIKMSFDERILKKNIIFLVQIQKNVPEYIRADAVKIQQILNNLINNSIKFTDFGSVCLFVSSSDNNELLIELKDTGIGIDKKTQEKLFVPFIQADNSTTRVYGGTGLGLSICKSLVNVMNGSINLKSSLGIGTSIFIKIPYTTRARDTLYKEIDKDDCKTSQEKIAIIEDNKINQIVLKKMLEKIGYINYEIYNNGNDFFKNKDKNIFSLILMDLHMPIMDGYKCTELLRKSGNNTPIIALTANAMSGEIQKCKNIGMNDFILKPIQINELNTKIFKWIQ